MPCLYEPSPAEREAAREARERKDSVRKARERARKKELDLVSRLLCEIFREHLPDEVIAENEEYAEWWERHKKADAARLKREEAARKKKAAAAKKRREKAKLKKEALAKLSAAERRALGLK